MMMVMLLLMVVMMMMVMIWKEPAQSRTGWVLEPSRIWE